MTGMIGVSPASSSNPAFFIPARKRRAFEARSWRRPSALSAIWVASIDPAATAKSEAVGEEIGTRSLSKQIDDGLRRRNKAAHRAAQTLAERSRDDIDLSHCARQPATAVWTILMMFPEVRATCTRSGWDCVA
jgi:hypothetical protein